MIAHYLHTIVLSGYYTSDDWQSWADNIILNNDIKNIEYWIFDVSLAKNQDELFNAIRDKVTVENMTDDYYFYWEPDIVIGYYYLLYKENRISLSELFERLGYDDDISNESIINYVDIMNGYVVNEDSFSESEFAALDKLLNPFMNTALEQKRKLRSYMIEEQIS